MPGHAYLSAESCVECTGLKGMPGIAVMHACLMEIGCRSGADRVPIGKFPADVFRKVIFHQWYLSVGDLVRSVTAGAFPRFFRNLRMFQLTPLDEWLGGIRG